MTPVVVYGASGVLGALVAAEVAARGAPLVLAGRDRRRLEAARARLPARRAGGDGRAVADAGIAVAAIHDRAALARAFAGAGVVIGCAGPFRSLGTHLAAAAVDAGAHLVDVAGDQGYLRRVHEEEDAPARRRGVVVAPGAGGLGALGDLAARWAAEVVLAGDAAAGAPAPGSRLADDAPLDEVTVAMAVDGFAPAPAARRAMIDAATAPGVMWRAGRWDPTRAAARGRTVDFGALGRRPARSFPAPEIITVPRHVAARVVDGYVALPDDPWARGLERLTPLAALAAPLAGLVAPLFETLIDPTAIPDEEARARARFAVVARARKGFAEAQVRLTGADVYALAARTVVDAALALAAAGVAADAAGARAPAELTDARAALRALERAGALAIEASFATAASSR